MKKFEQYQDMIARLFPEYSTTDDGKTPDGHRILSQSVTFQVSDECDLCCNYCYQINKGKRVMSIETAKKFIDLILSGDKGMSQYVDPSFSPAIILEFIGGEPLLQAKLIEEICDYFTERVIELQHPWATKHAFSICSNGVSYFNDDVQHLLNKYRSRMSFSVTIDGNKELHDSCRVFPDGSPSYDLAVAAAKDWMSRGYYMGSKITIAPENVMHLYDAVVHMIHLGYDEINANCVYEKGWNTEHATVLYDQMKKLADYFLENDLDFERKYYVSLFTDTFFKPKREDDLENWCFKGNTDILTPSGNIPISELKVGDKVITLDGSVETVQNVVSRMADDTAIVNVNGLYTYTTKDHPYLCRKYYYNTDDDVLEYGDPQWVRVADIRSNDCIAMFVPNENIMWVPVTDIYTNNIDRYEVYNLTVSNKHSFIANGFIVHNCGGNGVMLSCDPDGVLYPCIRYMESSLGTDQEPYSIGNVDIGICQTECDKCRVECLKKIDRRTQSTDECFYCPIAEGCSWWITPTIVVTL